MSAVDVDTVLDAQVTQTAPAPVPAAATGGPVTTSTASAAEGSSAADICHPYAMHNRVVISKLLAQGKAALGQQVTVGGWVKTGRQQGKGAFVFLEVNDGSTPKNLQCMVREETHDLKQLTPTGTSVLLRGVLEPTPDTAKTPFELKVDEVLYVGPCDPATYPVAKTKLSLEFLRTVIHLRPRTNIISAITRIRNALAFATHRFFQERGFLYCHTPLITASDCEGAGEMFQVRAIDDLLDGPLQEASCSILSYASVYLTGHHTAVPGRDVEQDAHAL